MLLPTTNIGTKNIILTGASRGIGLAIARFLLRSGHRVLCVARTREPLETLQEEFPGQVEVLVGDLQNFEVGAQAVAKALSKFNSIDGLVINHAILSPIQRLADANPAEWRSAFDVNFFSAISLIQPAILSLRETKGRIIITSSGAAVNAYAGWGSYGAAKAALNHLVHSLSIEEPLITSIAVRPGIVDTKMQDEVRGYYEIMDHADVEKFRSLHLEKRLLRPEQPGDVMARLVLCAGRELSGKFFSWDATDLAKFQN